MKKYEKPSLIIESLVPDTQIASNGALFLNNKDDDPNYNVIISGNNGWYTAE